MRSGFQFRRSAAILLVAAGVAVACAAQAADSAPPKELLQYIQEARRNGLKEDKIKQQALQVGWPAGVVDQAIAEAGGKTAKAAVVESEPAAPARTEESEGPAAPAAVTASPAATPATSTGGAVEAAGAATVPTGNLPTPDSSQAYQIAAGDTLQVSVWKEPEVSVPTEIVRPDGKITMPLIKEVEVAGLTPKEAEKRITEQLSKFYTDANVTVVVTAMAPKKIYVTGGVKKEGPITFTDGIRVMQAISEAGGLTDYAKRKRIYILHTENGREYRLDFNYDEVLKGVRMEQNVLLAPGDTVVIPN